jgi:hypothetical protein
MAGTGTETMAGTGIGTGIGAVDTPAHRAILVPGWAVTPVLLKKKKRKKKKELEVKEEDSE